MSPPRRRSSRLRSSNATPGKSTSYASSRLTSLAEHDETPTSGPQSNLDAIVSSPLAPRTPATGRVKASQEEMHPSKAQQSTTKEPDSGLRLGFTDIEVKGNNLPSGVSQQSPSKVGISSPSFDFRFARPGPELGPEAQRMMDDLREEALRIKAKLAAEREEEKRRAGESAGTIGGRKFAHPKRKVGRFSEVHMAEFKKMDSIAGHASAFRGQPGRLTPATHGLKRTQSKAQLEDGEGLSKDEQSSGNSSRGERLENTAPAKRARKRVRDDTSSARPISRGNEKPLPATPATTRTQSSMIASITTPTQASLARASSRKVGSQIPTLARSPSKPNLNAGPQGIPKSARRFSTAPSSGIRGILRSPGKFDRMRSLLRHPSSTIKQSMPSSIPSVSRSPIKPDSRNEISVPPSTPGGPSTAGTKHAMYSPEITSQHSPSPMKSGIPRSTSKINFGRRNHPVGQGSGAKPQSTSVRYPELPSVSDFNNITTEVEYPSLAGVRPLAKLSRQPPAQSKTNPPPSVPGTFTFRSDHTISFGKSPKGFGSSPGQASVRQVRPSIFPMPVPGSFPDGNKENDKPLPSVPHGMSNKKRRRVDSDEEEEEEAERSPKKHKSTVAEGQMLMAPRIEAEKMASMTKAQTPSPNKKKGVLSLSRLNMLARPKFQK